MNWTFPGFGAGGLPIPPGLKKLPGGKTLIKGMDLPNKVTSKVRSKMGVFGDTLDSVDKAVAPLGKGIEKLSNKPSDKLLG